MCLNQFPPLLPMSISYLFCYPHKYLSVILSKNTVPFLYNQDSTRILPGNHLFGLLFPFIWWRCLFLSIILCLWWTQMIGISWYLQVQLMGCEVWSKAISWLLWASMDNVLAVTWPHPQHLNFSSAFVLLTTLFTKVLFTQLLESLLWLPSP